MTVIGVLVACLAITQPQLAPNRKVALPNGVMLYAERIEGAQGFTMQMSVNALGQPEEPGQSGYWHLLEHLSAVGAHKDIDKRLESQGMDMNAATGLDGLSFTFQGMNDQIGDAIPLLKELLSLREVTQKDIDREVQIIRQEEGASGSEQAIYDTLIETGFGFKSIIGTHADLAKATPEAIKAIYQEMFVPGRITIAVVGEIDPTKVVEQLRGVFESMPKTEVPKPQERALKSPLTEGFAKGASGCGRGVSVGSISKPETIAALAAAFALAFEIPDAHVAYSPSAIGGMVCLVHPTRKGLDGVDELIANAAARLYKTGQFAMAFWSATLEFSPDDKADLYAMVLGVEGFFRMDDLVRRATQVSQADFTAALQKFYSASCVKVGGVR